MSVAKPSKKHHFVPQAQLRRFAADADEKFLFAFDKRSDKSFRVSILNAGSENDFNTVELAGSKWNFEDLFGAVDTRSASLVGRILEEASLSGMSVDDRVALADFVAVQLVRTRFSRTTPGAIVKGLREMIRQVGHDPEADPSPALPDETAVRLSALKAFLRREAHLGAIARLVPCLYRPAGETRFVISDHPVVRSNAFAYGDSGLSSPGVMVHLPLSPTMALALLCPTIVARYAAAELGGLEPERRARIAAYRDGMRTGHAIDVDDATVGYLNSLQVAQSATYVYAHSDDFDFARTLLSDRPELRSVESHISFGEMGMAPPRRSGMPSGWQLVIFGAADHCMLAIDELDEEGEGITAATSNIALLHKVAADPGELRVELYCDGQVRRGMSQVIVELVGDGVPAWFRVVHRDPAMRALAATLDAKPG